jgi:RecA/RadA recombinase
MATKQPKTDKTDKTEEKDNLPTVAERAVAMMKAKGNKENVLNFEETLYYKTRSSSLTLTARMGGGLPAGAARSVGITAGGKSSCTLDFMYQFLKSGKNRFGFYVDAEGRLSPEVRERSGIRFVLDPALWEEGTCLILESNVYETIFGMIGDYVRNNPTKAQFFFVLDSMDMICRQEDIAKPLTESQRVAGGALITSTFLKQTAAALAKRGHTCVFISQVREEIKGQYEVRIPRQGNASGGHALEHQGSWVFQFLPRNKDDKIFDGDKVIGHYCKVRLVKTTNESDGVEVRYPIRYGRKGGTSVWVEREIGDLMLAWEWVEKKEKSSWLNFPQKIRDEVKEATGIDMPEKVQGMDAVYALLEGSPKLVEYFYDKCCALIASGV